MEEEKYKNEHGRKPLRKSIILKQRKSPIYEIQQEAGWSKIKDKLNSLNPIIIVIQYKINPGFCYTIKLKILIQLSPIRVVPQLTFLNRTGVSKKSRCLKIGDEILR